MAFQSDAFQSDAFQQEGGGGSLTANAVLLRGSGALALAADAVVHQEQSGSLTADALIVFVGGASLAGDAILRQSQSGSFTVDAVISTGGSTQSGSLTADAVARRAQAAALTADAVLASVGNASLAGDAILRLLWTETLAADAWVRRSQTGSVTADAVLQRAVSASLVMDAVARRAMAGSFTADSVFASWFRADAIVLRTQEASFTAGAWIYAPRADPEGPGGPGETPLVSIMVEGVDITADVILSDASFTMQVNGTPGPFRFRVRDDGQAYVFVSGAEVTLDIDGKRKFGGFLISPKHGFAFPVMNTSDPASVSRFWTLEGVDYNILFSKRVIRDKGDPSDVKLRSWPAGSRDDVIIKYIFDNYTDLAADGVTYDGVTHVDSPNPDKKGIIGSGGLTFGDAMTEINRLINGVFYINQYKDLHFVDVETPNATYGLSDRPETGEIGYRELEKTNDGTKLANDALVWAAGLGSKLLKFSRSQDATSIAAHKRWQYGDFSTQLIKQTSADTRAESIVYGTAQSKRGGKDDQESWRVITFSRTFEVGQKVQIETEVFGQSDVVPIRRMVITFPSKKKPKFELLLSHEIDLPWNTFETRFPKIKTGFSIGDIDIPDPVFPPPGGCEDIAGITDTFTRTVTGGWGTSDAGMDWDTEATAYVDGTQGCMIVASAGSAYRCGVSLAYPSTWPMDVTVLASFNRAPSNTALPVSSFDSGNNGEGLSLWPGSGSTPYIALCHVSGIPTLVVNNQSNTQVAEVALGFPLTSPFYVNWALDSGTGTLDIRAWAASGSKPSSATATVSVTSLGSAEFNARLWANDAHPFAGGDVIVALDSLDIDGINRVSEYRFDNFNRVVASGWGTSDTGYAWTVDTGGTKLSTDGAEALLAPWNQSPSGPGSIYAVIGSLLTTAPFTMTWRISFAAAPPSAAHGGMSVSFYDPSSSGQIELWFFRSTLNDLQIMSSDGSGYLIDDGDVVGGFWSGGTTYLCSYAWDGVNHVFSVTNTATGAVETRTIASATRDATTFSSASLRLVVTNAVDTTAYIDYIDFDYDGKPCYEESVTDDIDDFGNRTVAATTSPNLGTTSSGYPTTTYGPYANATLGISGGLLTFTGPAYGASAVSYGVDLGPSYQIVEIGGMSSIYARFRTSYIPTGGTLSNYAWIQFDVSGTGGFTFTAAMAAAYGNGGGWWGCHTFYSASVTANVSTLPRCVQKTDWQADTWYTIKATIDANGDVQVKLWADGDPEPDFSVADDTAAPYPWNPADGGLVSINGKLEWDTTYGGYPNNQTLDVDGIWVKSMVGVGASGSAGELAGRSGQSGTGAKTVFTLDYAYHWGSTRVFVDGYIQRRGIEYTESDPDGGEITFTTAPADGAAVTILYEANGSPH